MPFVSVRDIRMYYEIRGNGPRLLFISGTGGDLRRSPNAFDSPLPQHFAVLGYDQRGLGQTDRPDIPYTMADYAQDATALLDAVGWERCAVIGISFGGMVAQELAVRYPHTSEAMAVRNVLAPAGLLVRVDPQHGLADKLVRQGRVPRVYAA